MEPNAVRFFLEVIHPHEVKYKNLIDVGSRLIDMSLKPIIKSHWYNPATYIGIDLFEGEYVDQICSAENIVETFGENSFEFVLCVEMLEHVKDWRKVISNLKRCCTPEGFIFITTRMPGWPKHDFPGDYWRYTPENMKVIFSDCIIENLGDDEGPEYLVHRKGVFVKVKKPEKFIENDLSKYELDAVP